MALASEKKILVVDDEPDVRNFLAACIGDAGFRVDTAVDGVDALEKIRRDPPDLVTLDMVMPRKSGIKVIRELRQDEAYARLPVIIITAHAHDEFGSEDIKNFNAFASGLRPRYTMEKPVTPQKLVGAICEILAVEVAPQDSTELADKQAILSLLNGADPENLKKIRQMLDSGR
jgi:two-component system alkaline phosphatase synthesis response regulator PhoP